MKYSNHNLLIIMVLVMVSMAGCSNRQHDSSSESIGYNNADSVISAIGDRRDFPRLLAVTDSFQRAGDISQVRAIFYSTIAYNLMGQRNMALRLYYQLANIDMGELNCQANIESYVYTYKDYVRLLCDMRRYDRALREAYNADRKLKTIGYDSFVKHHDISQMIGESQLSWIRLPRPPRASRSRCRPYKSDWLTTTTRWTCSNARRP